MDQMTANDVGMHLTNAAQSFYNIANQNVPGAESTLQEYSDFNRMGNDLVFKWHDSGQDKEVSLNDVWEFMNGGTRDQITQLLDTVTNLEERLESMEFYNNDEPQSA